MEGMRHKLSLPGLGMSKCTDPSGRRCRLPGTEAPAAPCPVCREAAGRQPLLLYVWSTKLPKEGQADTYQASWYEYSRRPPQGLRTARPAEGIFIRTRLGTTLIAPRVPA